MAKRTKEKPKRETKKKSEKILEAIREAKSTETKNDSGNTDNVGSTSDNEVTGLLEGFDEPKIEETPEVDSTRSGGDDGSTGSGGDVTTADEPPRRRERKPRESKKEKKAFKVPGKLLVKVTNRVMTGLVCTVDGFVSKNPIDPEFISLTDEDLNDEELIELAKDVLDAFKATNNPYALFFGSMGATILTNYSTARAIVSMQLRTERLKNENLRRQQELNNANARVTFDGPQG